MIQHNDTNAGPVHDPHTTLRVSASAIAYPRRAHARIASSCRAPPRVQRSTDSFLSLAACQSSGRSTAYRTVLGLILGRVRFICCFANMQLKYRYSSKRVRGNSTLD